MVQYAAAWLGDQSFPLKDVLRRPHYRELWLMDVGHAILELLEFEQ
jgi:hypothetical protein